MKSRRGKLLSLRPLLEHLEPRLLLSALPTVLVTATKPNAWELNGATTGAGIFSFRRSGSTAGPLTVDFTLTGTATEGVDYNVLPTHSINFTTGQRTAMLQIHPIDDALREGPERVTLTIVADATAPAYRIAANPAWISIADDPRPIFTAAPGSLAAAVRNTALGISYAQLVTQSGLQATPGHAITFKLARINSGTLKRNNAPAAVHASIALGDALAWTPASNAAGTTPAFSVIATDGTHSTGIITISMAVSATVGIIPHPDVMQVMPAALDQPQINAIIYVGNNTTPQVGTTTTIDPLTLDDTTVSTFNVTGYLDTGASSILISNPTNTVENLPLLQSGGNPVIYSDVGVAGSDNFQVSDKVRLSLAGSYQRTDLDQFSDSAQTQPITTPYTPIPAPNNSLRVQVGPFVPTVDNPITDEFDSLFSDLSAVDVIGMPSMMGRVTVIDPMRVNNFGSVLDALLNDPNNFDLSALDADLSVHSFIYAPGTPFHPSTIATDPGIPATDLHVQLSYASFDRFTAVTPAGQPGPTLAHNPIIGQDPVRLLDGTTQPDNPGITITRDISNGTTGTQTLSSTGNWLLDTGAAASIISTAQAAKLQVTVTHQTNADGTDNPILVDQDGNPLPDQFQLAIGGIGGQETLAGFYLDSLTVPTQEGSGIDLSNANNLHFTHEPVLVGNITVKDPTTSQTLTLDGIFGMNNLIGSADFSLGSDGNIGNFDATQGYFNWITFDEPNGILGLSYDPAVLTAAAATPATPRTATASPSLHLPLSAPATSQAPAFSTATAAIASLEATPSDSLADAPALSTTAVTIPTAATPATTPPTPTLLQTLALTTPQPNDVISTPAPLTSPLLTSALQSLLTT